MKIETMMVIITGILVIGALEVLAMVNGVNGVALAAAIAAVTGIITGTFTFLITKARIKRDGDHSLPPAPYEE